jgi:hypothetical protein
MPRVVHSNVVAAALRCSYHRCTTSATPPMPLSRACRVHWSRMAVRFLAHAVHHCIQYGSATKGDDCAFYPACPMSFDVLPGPANWLSICARLSRCHHCMWSKQWPLQYIDIRHQKTTIRKCCSPNVIAPSVLHVQYYVLPAPRHQCPCHAHVVLTAAVRLFVDWRMMYIMHTCLAS